MAAPYQSNNPVLAQSDGRRDKTPSAVKTDVATVTPTHILYNGPDREAITDLRLALQGYRAGEIKIQQVESGTRAGQEFYLERKNQKTLIKYTVNTSLENAVYTLLDRWGFHWYGPGANWFVQPAFVTREDIAGRWFSPTFRNRTFFGTGGLDITAPGDPANHYKTQWYAWKRRNRFNADFVATGHAGMAFYQENKALLDSHLDWFSSEIGKQNGRIKIEIPEAVAAYKAWIRRKYGSSAGPFICVGVEPEDGRGGGDDPLPPDGFAGIRNWNHADKWWWLANEVAKEYPEQDSHVVVSMYAYGDGPTNVLTPKFPLRKNVYPVIIPYAFQTAYLPQEMVKAWAGKSRGKMGLYDYWNITQWSQGLPQFNIYDLKNKLTFWHDNRVDGTYIETTDAAGPMGHSWWLVGQLQFDLRKDFNALYNQYLTDLFGRAAPAMKRMYDRWSLHPQGAGEVSLSLADLQSAEGLVANNSPEWKRINELKAYLHFMKLTYGHDGTQASKDRIYTYLYSIHHLFMVQTAAFMGQWYISPLDKGNVIPKGTDRRLTAEEIDAQFKADLVSDPKKYDVTDFRFDYARAVYTDPIDKTAWRFGRNTLACFVPKTAGTISFDAGAEKGDTHVTVFVNDNILINEKAGASHFDYTETFEGRAWYMKRYTLKVETGKKYYARFKGAFSRFKMNSDLVVYNVHNNDDFDNYAYPPQYFYVPRDCAEIVFEDVNGSSGSTGAFYTPGQRANLTRANYGAPIGIKNLFRVAVKPEWRGKVIACAFAHTGWSLKNLPNVLSMQNFGYRE